MNRRKKIFIYILGPTGTFLLGMGILLWFWQTWTPWAITKLTNRILKGEATVQIHTLKGRISRDLTMQGITIVSHGTDRNIIIKINEIQAKYHIWDLLLRRFYFDTLKIDRPQITVQAVLPDTAVIKKKKYFNVKIPEIKVPNVNLRIGQFYLSNAHLSVNVNDQQYTLDSLSTAFQSRIQKNDLDFNLQDFSAIWREKNFRLKRFAFHFLVEKGSWSFRDWEFQSNAADIQGFGAVTISEEKNIGIHFSSDSVDVAKILALVDTTKKITGALKFDLQIQGTEEALKLNALIRGNLKQYQIEKGFLQATLYPRNVSLDSVLIQINQASIHGKATVNSDERFRAQVRFERINLQRMIPNGLVSDLAGRIYLEGKGLAINHMVANIQAHLDTIQYKGYPLGKIHFFAKMNQGKLDIADSTRWEMDNNLVSVSGWLNTDNEIDVSARVHQVKLDEILRAVEIKESSGNLTGSFQVSGSWLDPTIRSNLQIEKLHFKALVVDTVTTKVDVSKLMTDRKGYISFKTSSGKLGPIPITAGDGSIITEGKKIYLKELKLYNANDYAFVNGVITTGPDQTVIELNDVRAVYQNYDLQNVEPISVLITPEGIGVERVELLTPGGQLRFGGTFFKPDSVYFFGAVENFDLAPIFHLTKFSIPLEGFLSYQFSFAGTLKNPNLELELKLNQAAIDSIPIQSLKIDGSYKNQKFILNKLEAIQDSAKMIAHGEAIIPFDFSREGPKKRFSATGMNFTIMLNGVDVRAFRKYHRQKELKSGKFYSEMNLEGSLEDLKGSLKIFSNNLQYKNLKFRRFSLDGNFNNHEFRIDSLQINVAGFPIFLQGKIPFDLTHGIKEKELFPRPMSLGLNIKTSDLSILPLMSPKQIEEVNGTLEADLHITGNPFHPVFAGKGNIKLDNLLLIKMYNEPKKITGKIEIRDNILKLTEVQGFVTGDHRKSGGKFTLLGTVNISNPIHPLLDLSMNGKDIYYEDALGEIQAYNDIDLNITGRDTIAIKGSITVNEVLITSNFNESGSSASFSSPEPPYVAMDIGVALPRSVHVKNNDMDIWLDGYLHMIAPPNKDYYFLGQLEIFKDGKYVFPPDIFTVREGGKITFDQPEKFDPRLDVTAAMYRQGTNIVIEMSGTLKYPKVQFKVYKETPGDLNWTQGEIMNFLGTSRRTVQGAVDSSGAVISEQAMSRGYGIANSFLEKQIARTTGLDEFTFGSGKTGLAQAVVQNNYNELLNEQFTVGKQLGRSFYLRFSSSLTDISKMSLSSFTTHTARLGIEYRISRYFSIIGGFEKNESSSNINNIGTVDLLFRYEY